MIGEVAERPGAGDRGVEMEQRHHHRDRGRRRLPAVPDSRLSAPSSASMNSSAFFSAVFGNARRIAAPGPEYSAVRHRPPAAASEFRRRPAGHANMAARRRNTRPKVDWRFSAPKKLTSFGNDLIPRFVHQPVAGAFDDHALDVVGDETALLRSGIRPMPSRRSEPASASSAWCWASVCEVLGVAARRRGKPRTRPSCRRPAHMPLRRSGGPPRTRTSSDWRQSRSRSARGRCARGLSPSFSGTSP